eukprot:4478881-Prymnesium_polylepis.1
MQARALLPDETQMAGWASVLSERRQSAGGRLTCAILNTIAVAWGGAASTGSARPTLRPELGWRIDGYLASLFWLSTAPRRADDHSDASRW